MASFTAILLHINASPYFLLTIWQAMHHPSLVLYASAYQLQQLYQSISICDISAVIAFKYFHLLLIEFFFFNW